MTIKLDRLEKELKELRYTKVTKELIDNKVQNSKKKENIGEDTSFKDVDIRNVYYKEDNTNRVKGQKSRIKETKKSIFIFGAEARKSMMEKKEI